MEPKSNTASAIDENRPESEGSATATATEAAPAAVESFTKVVQISSEENAARSRWAAYFLNRAFMAGRPSTTGEWSDAYQLAGWIRSGLVRCSKITIPNIPAPTKPIERRALRTAFYAVKRGPWRGDSDRHIWLKLVAKRWLDSKGGEAEYEYPYGPCAGDVRSGETIVECGDTPPHRVQAIFDQPLTFISLPYQDPDEFSKPLLRAFSFSLTEKGRASGFVSEWEGEKLRAFEQQREFFRLHPHWPEPEPEPTLPATPQEAA